MLDLLRKRRSIRKFETREVEKEKVEQLIKAALLSPSSRNLRPWEFIIIDDKETLKKLSGARQGAAFLDKAPLGIVILADPEKCDVWIEDSSIATIIIQLTAQSLGLGSCWIQVRERFRDFDLEYGNSGQSSDDYIKGILNIPNYYKVESMVGIGYPAVVRAPNKDENLLYDKIHLGEYGVKFYKN